MPLPKDKARNLKVSVPPFQNATVIVPPNTLKSLLSAFQSGCAAYMREKPGKWRGRGDGENARMQKDALIFISSRLLLTAHTRFSSINQG